MLTTRAADMHILLCIQFLYSHHFDTSVLGAADAKQA